MGMSPTLKNQPVNQVPGARSRSMARGAEVLISTRIYAVLDLEDDDLPDADRVRLIIEEQDVAALEGGLHAAAQHNYHGRFAFS